MTMKRVLYLQVALVMLSISFFVMGVETISEVAYRVATANTDLPKKSGPCSLEEKVVIGFAGCTMLETVSDLNKQVVLDD